MTGITIVSHESHDAQESDWARLITTVPTNIPMDTVTWDGKPHIVLVGEVVLPEGLIGQVKKSSLDLGALLPLVANA